MTKTVLATTPMKSEIIQVGQIGIRFRLEAADTNGTLAMFEFTVPVGARMPLPHKHDIYFAKDSVVSK